MVLQFLLILVAATPPNAQYTLTCKLEGKTHVKLRKYNFDIRNYETIIDRKLKGTHQLVQTDFEEPTVYRISIGDQDLGRIFVDGPGHIIIHKKEDKYVVEGSPGRERLSQFHQTLSEYEKRFAPYKDQADRLLEDENWDQIAEVNIEVDRLLDEFYKTLRNHLEDMGTSGAAYVALQALDIHKQAELFEIVLSTYQLHHPNAGITTVLEEKVAKSQLLSKGKTMEDFVFPNQSGTMVSLKKYRGKLVLVDFWATWCPNCLIEFPELKKIYRAYKTHGFEILGITTNDNPKKWQHQIEKSKLEWTNLFDEKAELYQRLDIKQLPANVLIDENGQIIGSHLSPTELEHILSERFNGS